MSPSDLSLVYCSFNMNSSVLREIQLEADRIGVSDKNLILSILAKASDTMRDRRLKRGDSRP